MVTEKNKKSVTILGSTGSVGSNTVDLLAREPNRFSVEALVAGRNAAKLAVQARQLGAKLAVVADESAYPALKDALQGSGIAAAAGRDAVIEAAERPSDWVMAAIVGAAGLAPTLAAIRRGAIIGLANKETLVCAGKLVLAEAAKSGASLIPVDSEHSAIFQVLEETQRGAIEKLVLTASGGPFRTMSRDAMAGVTPEQAVAHPNWKMGAKISVDSASMMNKGLEIIEAHHLFAMPESAIEVLVHPQSAIHSMVAYADGSMLAQLGTADMRTPISYALGWPDRLPFTAPRLDLAALGRLTFESPDPERFPALTLAREVLRQGGGAPTIMNAANEVAVAAFLDRGIGFLDIVHIAQDCLERMGPRNAGSLEEVAALDAETRRLAGLLSSRMTMPKRA